MSLESALAAGRAAAEDQMVDTCTITRPGEGKGPWNDETGQYDPSPPVVVYSGPCRVQVPGEVAGPRAALAGEREWTLQSVVVMLPVAGSQSVRVGNTVHMDTGVHDPALLGREFAVRALHHKSHATARRLRCEEPTG